jgi:large subunit ribosomal protein L23
MALFSKKEKKSEEKTVKKVTKKASKTVEKVSDVSAKTTKTTNKNLSNVISKPRITEKAAVMADVSNSYTFNVSKDATKKDVAMAIEKIYKVVPVKINIMINPRKVVRNRKGVGFKGGNKKAMVFLKKGDKIEFV